MSVLIFLVVLVVLILVHEWGHFIVAKKTGMRVDEFGIGFPPKAFGIKRGETEYTINWLPIGGFVRIFGENGDEAGDVSEADKARAFSARPKWAQALVLIAGVTMNVLLAWVLFATTYMVGVPTAIESADATDAATLYVAGTIPNSPAAVIPAGAEILSVTAGERTLDSLTPEAFTAFVTEVAPDTMSVTYETDGESMVVDIVPAQGLDSEQPERYLAGVSLALIEVTSYDPLTALSLATETTISALGSIALGLGTLLVQTFTGAADYSQIAGPIGIVGMVGDAASFGFTALLTFMAIISLNLAVINLLPFPALDGGRLVFVAIEAITNRRIPPVWANRVNLIGFGLLMLLMIAVTYNDIIRLF